MIPPAGTQMPEYYPHSTSNSNHYCDVGYVMCGGYNPCKLGGSHPNRVGQIVERRVHCHKDNERNQHKKIKVRNCGGFYIYYLKHFSAGKVCHVGHVYCAENRSFLRQQNGKYGCRLDATGVLGPPFNGPCKKGSCCPNGSESNCRGK